MPNYCYNTLRLHHANPAEIDSAMRALKRGDFLTTFVPTPKDLEQTIAGTAGAPDSPEQIELDQRRTANLERYGYPDWYEWRIDHWGTKWDVEDKDAKRVSDNTLTACFMSAWAPPVEAYNHLQDMGFTIEATYVEEGACFVGEYNDGVDNCYSFYTPEDLKQIPERLRDLMSDDLFEEIEE